MLIFPFSPHIVLYHALITLNLKMSKNSPIPNPLSERKFYCLLYRVSLFGLYNFRDGRVLKIKYYFTDEDSVAQEVK